MVTSSSAAAAKPKPSAKTTAAKAAPSRAKKSPARKRTKKSATSVAIATELAPAVAIALLDKTEQAPGDPPPALDVLAVGAVPSEITGNVRMQLVFDNGAVLPVEMSAEAGAALSKGLLQELPKK